MSEQTPVPPGSPNDPNAPLPTPPAGAVPARAAAPAAPPRRRRRRWIWVTLLVIVLLVLGLVLLAPTIAGSGPVVSMILGTVNKQYVNGHVTVDNLSLGWFGGTKIEGVKVFDDQNAEVASVGQITTPLTVLDVVRGKFDLGDAYVKGVRFDAKIVASKDGPTTNFQQLLKPQPPAKQPAKLPDLKGKLHLEDVSGKIQDTIHPQTTSVDALPGEVDIADINQPIDFNFDASLGYNGKSAGKAKLAGNVGAVQNNYVAADKLSAALTATFEQLDLAAAGPVVTLAGQDRNYGGTFNGGIKADVKSMSDMTASGQPTIDHLRVPVKEDTVSYKTVSVPFSVSLKGEGSAAMVTADASINADADVISVKVNGPQAVLQSVPALFQQVAAQLSGDKANATPTTAQVIVAATGPAGAAGQATAVVTAKLDAARLVAQLPHVLMLKPGTALSSGQLAANVHVNADASNATVAADTTVNNLKGTQDGKPVALDDITTKLNATAVGGARPQVRDLALNIASAFLNVDGGGATLANTQFKGNVDFKRLQQQFGQIVDLDAMLKAPPGSHVQIAGTGTFSAGTHGDLTAPDGILSAKANLTLLNLVLSGIGKTKPVNQDKVVVDASGDVHHTADVFAQDVRNLLISLTAPSAQVQLSADVSKTAKGYVAPRFELSNCTVDVARFAHDFRPVLAMAAQATTAPSSAAQPAAPSLMQSIADGTVTIDSGTLTAGAKGSYDGTNFSLERPIEAHVKNLGLSQTDAFGNTKSAREQAIDLTANADPAAAGGQIKNLKVLLAVGPEAARILNLTLGADVILAPAPATQPAGTTGTAVAATAPAGKTSVPRFDIALSAPDLAKAQADLGPMLAIVSPPAPATQPADAASPSLVQALAADLISVTSGSATLNASGSYDGTTPALSKPATFDLKNFHVVKRPPGGAVEDVLRLTDAAGTATLASKGDALQVAADVTATGISSPNVLNNETLRLTPKATISKDYTVVTDTGLKLDSSFAGVDVSNVSLNLGATDPLDKLKSAHVTVTNANLAELMALKSAFAAPAPAAVKAAETETPAAAAAAPLPDLEIPSGVANLTLDVSHDNNQTSLNLSNCTISNLSLRRGTNTFAFPKDVTADVKAVATGSGSKIGQLTVSALNASLGVCQVALADNKPLNVTNADDMKQMAADGTFSVTGQGPLTCRLVEVLTGKAKGAYPYAGKYTITEAISKAAGSGVALLKGGVTVDGLKVLSSVEGVPAVKGASDAKGTAAAEPQAIFSEDQFVVSNNLKADLDAHNLTMDANDPVSVVMKSSGALGLKLWGTVNDWAVKRDLDVQANADYDLAKLWPIVKPMVVTTPDSSLKDLIVEGKFQKHFWAKGAVPADIPFQQAVKQLQGGGALAVGKLNVIGLDIADLEVPFTLANGMVRNVYSEGSNAGQYARPAACNGGTIDLGHDQVDMTQATPTLTMPDATADKPYPLLAKVGLNQVLAAKGLGDFINNPAFANADSASGVVRMVVLQCTDFPLGQLAKQAVPENKGVLKLRYTVDGITLGNQNLATLLDLVHANEKTVNGEIRGATISIEHGVTTTDTEIALRNNTIPLRFAGGVNMASQSIVPGFTVSLPMAGFVGDKNIAQYLPDAVPVGLSGFIKAPKVDAGNAISNAFAGAAQKAAVSNVGNLLGGNKKGNNAAGATGQPADNNPIGGLLNGVLGGDKNKAGGNPAAPNTAAPNTASPNAATPNGNAPAAAPAATPQPPADNNPIGGLLNNVLGGDKQPKPADNTAAPATSQPANNDNPVNDLLNAIGGEKKKKK